MIGSLDKRRPKASAACASRPWRRVVAAAAATAVALAGAAEARAGDVLVADRLSNAVYRYSASGTLLGTVVSDSANLNEATGLALSPDAKHLYVSSYQSSRVMRYDYNYATGMATGGVVFADQADGLAAPSAILFSPDQKTIYVSNLGGTGVARLKLDGTTAGASIFFAAPPESTSQFQFSGLTQAPSGQMFVGAWKDFPAGTRGAVGLYSGTGATMTTFLPSAASLDGASGLLVHEGFLYVTGMFASNIQRFDATTGARDASFLVSGLTFPQQLMLSPDGNGFLAGILGLDDGEGHIAHYDFQGQLIGDGVFASHGGGGFVEATAFITVPDPPPGDFNSDFLVNSADLAIWRANAPNATGTATRAMGDADGNGLVDGNDFLVWQRHLTAPTGPGAHAAPEPGAAVLLLIGLAALKRRRRPRCGDGT